jgi:nicotinamidase-related amidase
MRSRYENGYQVITLSDCVAATSAEEHDNALRYDYPMFSKPMTSSEFMEALG